MTGEAASASLFDVGRFASVTVLAALVVLLDVTVLELVGIESAAEAVAQYGIVTLGSYLGFTLVDVTWDRLFGE